MEDLVLVQKHQACNDVQRPGNHHLRREESLTERDVRKVQLESADIDQTPQTLLIECYEQRPHLLVAAEEQKALDVLVWW
jgi:hypothetical protein